MRSADLTRRTGCWMREALPLATYGLVLDKEAVHVTVSLTLRHALCAPQRCICDAWVGQEGHHGLVCRRVQGRSLRHHTINNIIWRALFRAGVPVHGSQQAYLGQMVEDLIVQPWSLGRRENIWSGMLRWFTHASSVETDGSRRAWAYILTRVIVRSFLEVTHRPNSTT